MGQAQYNRLGALNNVIMVYPDTRCWDNAGDPDGIDPSGYNTKAGILPSAIKAMMDRVTGGTTDSGNSGSGGTGGNGSADLNTWLQT